MASNKYTQSNIPSEGEGILITNMKKQIKMISAQLQRLKEEENTSLSIFSLQSYSSSSKDNKTPTSYDVETKPLENSVSKKSKGIFENKPWQFKPKHNFTPLGKSYELTLEEILEQNIIILPKVTLAGVSFMSKYCAHHRHNLHKTSHCKS